VRFVEKAVIRPSRCAVLPHLPSGGNHPDGFIDTMAEMPSSGFDQHVYVSVVAVREMAKMIGWHSPETMDATENELEALKHRCAALEDEVQTLNKEFEAIDLLESAGYTSRKKPGRKPAIAPREA
jgi:uncharacterized protein (UPF0335 family)